MDSKYELHLLFEDSNSRKHREVLKNVRTDLDEEEVREVMEGMVALDRPQRNGVRKCMKAISAKLVVKNVIVLFDNSDQLPKTVAEKSEQQEPVKRAPRKKISEKTELSISEMTRYRPMTVAKILRNDLEQNGLTPETIDRYMAEAIKATMISSLLIRKKQIDPYLFNPTMKALFAQEQWSMGMIAQLDNLEDFFPAPDWLDLIDRYRKIGRQLTAEMFSRNGKPNYQKADQHIEKLLQRARDRFKEYMKQKDELNEKLQRMMAS